MSRLATTDVGERLRITREVFGRRQGAIARAVGISASQLTKLLKREPRALLQVNQRRREAGLHTLR